MRIGHVNSDHLWYGVKNGEGAALKDWKESGKEESTVVAVVKLAEVEALQSKLDQAVEALEFYANKDNWRKLPNEPAGMQYYYKIGSRDGEDLGPKKYTHVGGRRAREALKLIKGDGE